MTDFTQLPPDLPVPEDDGAAAHLPGRQVPDVTLAATSGEAVALGDLGPGRTIVYIYPMTGQPDVALPDGWDDIPGARGCTTEACDFVIRDNAVEHVFYPIFPPNEHAREVLHWLRDTASRSA